tara:strand:+ start:533 stop:682 length:150 start_codon:yes stop_codon:yes gene_type:complete
MIKELLLQQKYLKREDIYNSRKSNQKLLSLANLLDAEIKKNEKKSNKGL